MIGYALKTWKRLAFPALLFWVLAVCLFGSAIQIGWGLHQEKSQPCRLSVSAEAPELDAISQLDGVTACAKVYQVSAELTVAGYTGELTVYGVDSGFVEGELSQGVLFPDSSAMPYLVLNEAALKTLTKEGKPAETLDSVDWLSGDLQLGTVTAKLCGILKDESETPMAYMAQSAARDYLLQTTGAADTELLWVELRNFGASESVTTALTGAGYAVESGDERTQDWDVMAVELRWCVLSGVIAGLAAASILVKDLQKSRASDPVRSCAIQLLRVLIFTGCGILLGALIFILRWLLSR